MIQVWCDIVLAKCVFAKLFMVGMDDDAAANQLQLLQMRHEIIQLYDMRVAKCVPIDDSNG